MKKALEVELKNKEWRQNIVEASYSIAVGLIASNEVLSLKFFGDGTNEKANSETTENLRLELPSRKKISKVERILSRNS